MGFAIPVYEEEALTEGTINVVKRCRLNEHITTMRSPRDFK
jgi:hypothetical protein